MRRWLVTPLVILMVSVVALWINHPTKTHAQNQIPDQAAIFGAGSNNSGATTCSSTGGQPLYVGGNPAITWTLTFYVDGTNFTQASVGIQGAPAATGGVGGTQGTFTGSTGISIINGSANPIASATRGTLTISTYYPWIRVLCSAATGSNGTVYTTLTRNLAFFPVSVIPPGTSGSGGVVNSAVLIEGNDNSNPFVPVPIRVSSVANESPSDSTAPSPIGGNGYLYVVPPPMVWKTANPGNSGQASVTFTGVSGQSWVVDCIGYSAVVSQGQTATAANFSFSVADTFATYASKIFSVNAVVATGTSAGNLNTITDQPITCGLGITGHANSTMTIQFSQAITNGRESVQAGAHLIQ